MSSAGSPSRSGVGAPLPNPTGRSPRAAVVTNARAEASRRNGARSRGPKTAEGKARSAQNALRHGLRAEKFLVPLEEDAAAFEALQAALLAELAPVGAVQTVLAQRVVSAAWRLARADEIEAGVLSEKRHSDGGLGLAAIRDSNGGRALPTLPRYRNAALAEFLRCLRVLEARQAEARALAAPAGPPPRAAAEPARPAPTPIAARPMPAGREPRQEPNEPEARGNPGESGPAAPRTPGLAPVPATGARPTGRTRGGACALAARCRRVAAGRRARRHAAPSMTCPAPKIAARPAPAPCPALTGRLGVAGSLAG